MTKLHSGAVVILLAAIALVQLAPIVMPDRTGPRWQYRIEDVPDDQFTSELDRYGSAGWELVFARRAVDGKDKPAYEVIFKRPK
jgi:hypothetical protein